MKIAAVSQLKATLSKYLDQVKAGEEVLVTDRGKPIARIVPVAPGSEAASARILELERAGLARIGPRKLPAGFFHAARPKDSSGAVRGALGKERSEGR